MASEGGILAEFLQEIFNILVDSFGVLGLGASIFLLIIAMIIQAIIAPIASEAVLAASGGILYRAFGTPGLYAAIIGGIIGSLLGAIIAFQIARWVQGRVKERIVDNYKDIPTDETVDLSRKDRFLTKLSRFLARFIDEDSDDFIEIIEKQGFLIVLIGRILVFVPFDAISYAAGFTKIKFKDFMIATTIGTIPRVIFYVLLGAQLADALEENFPLFVALFVGFAGAIYGLYKWIMNYLKDQETDEVDAVDVKLDDDTSVKVPVEEDEIQDDDRDQPIEE